MINDIAICHSSFSTFLFYGCLPQLLWNILLWNFFSLKCFCTTTSVALPFSNSMRSILLLATFGHFTVRQFTSHNFNIYRSIFYIILFLSQVPSLQCGTWHINLMGLKFTKQGPPKIESLSLHDHMINYLTKNFIRNLVSKQRRRMLIAGYDLDMSYITDRLLAMSFPAERMRAMYRNPLWQVKSVLDMRHHDHYKVQVQSMIMYTIIVFTHNLFACFVFSSLSAASMIIFSFFYKEL